MEPIIEKFHNLGGSTISEHQKNFSAYRRELAKSEIDFDGYFSKLQPKTRQEEIFKIKLLQQHKRHDILYGILKTGDKINGTIILKDMEFLSIFEGVSGSDFVQKICPELSYVNRIKIVNRLGLKIANVDTAKDYFENVRDKYGLKTATSLLNACDEEFIQDMVLNYDLRLNQALLIRLYEKYPTFLNFYYEKIGGFEEHEKVGKHVANSDLKTYHSLLRYGCPKLGKSCLKRFLKKYKLEVLKYPNLMWKKRKVLLQNLSRDEYLVYLRSKLPKSVDDFQVNAETLRCFKALPKPERGDALFACFKERYGFHVTEDVGLLDDNVLEILSTADRLRFDLEDRPEMLPTCTSLPKLRELFLATKKTSKRLELGKKLLKTCQVNDDDKALLEVLKFFCENYNPLPTECFQDLGNLPLERLSAEHWDYINELRLCYQINNNDLYFMYDCLKKLLLYKILNGIYYLEDLKTVCKVRNIYHITLFEAKYVRQERECLIKQGNIFEEIYQGEELKYVRNSLIHEIISFNKKYPRHAITYQEFATVLRALIASLGDDKYSHFLYSVEVLLRAKPADIVKDEEVLDGLIRYAHNLYDDTLYMWFLKNRPDLMEKYSDLFFTAEYLSYRIYYEISKMHYSELYKVLVDKALDHLKRGESRGFVCSIKLLSNIKSIDLQPLIDKYLPEPECRVDASQPNMSNILTIQRSIIGTIKNASPPSNNITRTLYFCRGDYLKYALDPLYHSISHSPENMTEAVLEELLTRAVSVRKHTLHLVTCVGSVENKYRILKRFAETEKNASLKCFTIRKLFKCFLEERNEAWFELLKAHVGLLSSSWTTRQLVFQLKNVPKMFYIDYVEMLCNYCQSNSNMHFTFHRNLKSVSDGLSRRIIKDNLFDKNNTCPEIYRFIQDYLLREEDADFDCIKPPSVDNLEQRVQQIRTSRRFMEYTCEEFLKNAEQNTDMKVEVLDRLSEIFKGLEFKLLVDITKLLLIYSKHVINEDFLRETLGGAVGTDYFKYLKDDQVTQGVDTSEQAMKTDLSRDSTMKGEDFRKCYGSEIQANKNGGGEQVMETDLNEKMLVVYSLNEKKYIEHPSNENFVKILSNFIIYQQRSSLAIYGADVIPIFGELIRNYFENIYKTIFGNSFELLLRLVEVILDADYNQGEDITNIVIMCIFLLPKNSTKVSGYKKRRREVLEKIRKTDSDVVKLYLNWFLENCQK